MADGTAPAEDIRQEVDINLVDNDKVRGGVIKDEGIHQAEPEHVHTVYCYAKLFGLCEGPDRAPGE